MAYRDGYYDRAGDRNQPIKILSRPPTRAANGEIDTSYDNMSSWTVFRDLEWAAVMTQSGLDVIRSGAEKNKTLTTFTIPYSPSTIPDTSMAILWGGKYYEIQNVNQIEAEGTLVEILAQRVA